MQKALIAMSGGVDSSVAAYLTQQQGYECIGCTMKLYDNEDAGITGHTCCSLDDVADARAVAYSLGMDHYTFNFSDDFRENVIDKFVDSYRRGLTPNPCIDCNRTMKFAKLLERAFALDCNHVVTGHYAIIEKTDDGFLLKRAKDASKDQSYVLYMLGQKELSHILFPLGPLTKSEVRELAKNHGFTNAQKPESQDICFVPDGNYAKVVELHSNEPPIPGDFVDKEGNVLGRHKGIIHYTIGQRKGLGLSFDSPRYVCAIDAKNNTVVLGKDEELFSRELVATNFNWTLGSAPANSIKCSAKIRYRQDAQPAIATANSDGTVSLSFDEGQRAITPGQAVVLYDGDVVLGGGTIKGGENEHS